MAGYCGLTIRGDSTACPMPFGLDTYYNCVFDCAYCCFLGLAHVWGGDKPHRVLDLDWFKRKMVSGLKASRPKSPMAWAIKHRKTLRIGNKYDPLPPQEAELGITRQVLEFLRDLGWSVVIQSKNGLLLLEYADLLVEMGAIVTTTVTAGGWGDWVTLELQRPPAPVDRLNALMQLAQRGLQVGVITEPFIPGYHTLEQFEQLVNMVHVRGIERMNTYNLRMTPFVARRLIEIGLDVEAIWDANQDENWRALLQDILAIATSHGVKIGCPDFANAGRFLPTTNTCCGVDVERPCTFNIINWRKIGLERGEVMLSDVLATYDGVGNYAEGLALFGGVLPDRWHLGDCGIFERAGDGWKLS